MSWNNIIPVWLLDLDAILIPYEKHEISASEALTRLENNNTIPEHVKNNWLNRITYGFVWEVPRKTILGESGHS